MVLCGLLIAASGFIFIFAPGLPMGLLSRLSPPFRRELIYWGIGLWILTLLPSLFIQSLLRQALLSESTPGGLSGEPTSYLLTFLGALLTALIVQGAMIPVLRRQHLEPEALPPNGLALGFGIGLLVQVLTGLNLVGAGFQLMWGDTSTTTLASLAQANVLSLILSLLALIAFRPAVLAVRALQGFYVGRALREGGRFFWLAVLIDTVFVWAILAFQIALGEGDLGLALLGETHPLTSGLTIAYYLLAFTMAYLWLARQFATNEGKRKIL